MARRQYHRLTAATVTKLRTKHGRHPDGDGLYLDVTKDGVASWSYRYTMPGKAERNMGLGPQRQVTLAQARELADAARRLKQNGVDPIDHRRMQRLTAAAEGATPSMRGSGPRRLPVTHIRASVHCRSTRSTPV
jgi:Arm domain-containing DNA-binding protein